MAARIACWRFVWPQQVARCAWSAEKSQGAESGSAVESVNLLADKKPPETGEVVFFWDEGTAAKENGFYGECPTAGYFLNLDEKWTDWYYGTELDLNEFTHWKEGNSEAVQVRLSAIEECAQAAEKQDGSGSYQWIGGSVFDGLVKEIVQKIRGLKENGEHGVDLLEDV